MGNVAPGRVDWLRALTVALAVSAGLGSLIAYRARQRIADLDAHAAELRSIKVHSWRDRARLAAPLPIPKGGIR